MASQVLKNDSRPVWKGNKNDYEYAFIIGQDQDKIRGGYQHFDPRELNQRLEIIDIL